MFVKKNLLLLVCFYLYPDIGFSQTVGNYDQHEAFAPIFYPAFGDEVRTAAGTPGPKYWQNEARLQYPGYPGRCESTDFRQCADQLIKITVRNPLPFLWLQLDQNIYKSDSRGEATTPVEGGRYANPGFEGGYTIQSVSVNYQGREQKIHYLVNDTRMQIFLPEALKANGDSLKINIVYNFGIPEQGTDRMGRMETSNGWIYTIGAMVSAHVCV